MRPIAIRLITEDGNQPLADVQGTMEFKSNEEGHTPEVNIIITLNNIEFPLFRALTNLCC